MDAQRFDALTRALSPPGRRALVGLLLTLPGLGTLLTLLTADDAAAKGRRKRRKKRHKHGKGNGRHRKGKRNRKRCKAKSRARICANRCGLVKNKQTCKKQVNCGACACDPPCPACQRCDGSGQCRPDAAREGQSCGGPNKVCDGGVCVQTCLPSTADLQTAINATPAGGELLLCAGTWLPDETVSITQDLTLRGAGADLTSLDGQNVVRVLHIAGAITVTLQDLTVTGGRALDGGGIDNHGILTLRGVAVTGNTATDFGGGISNGSGALTLKTGSRVSGNTATVDAGGIYNFNGTVSLKTGSRVSGNTAGNGGGIVNFNGTVTLQDGSRVTGNTAADGGGILNFGNPVTVPVNAFVCDNLPSDDQCVGFFTGPCPNPDEVCPT